MDRLFESIVKGQLYHLLVGNDMHPAFVATARAVVGAVITGAIGFFAVWQSTDEVKVLLSASIPPALSYLGIRLGLEGLVDTAKYQNGKNKSL